MNFKTTIVLACLVSIGVGTWIWVDRTIKPAAPAPSTTLDFLQNKLTADKLTRVEVMRRPRPLEGARFGASVVGSFAMPLVAASSAGVRSVFPAFPEPQAESGWQTVPAFVLQRTGKEWHLPGNWPVRPVETEQFIGVLTSLKTRFAPIYLTGRVELAPYGLDEAPLIVRVTVGDETQTLRFGQEPDSANRFTRATYVRLGGEGEVLQLGPGVFAALDRKEDYFQQRRLFPIDRVAKSEDSDEKVDQLDAIAVEVQGKNAKFTIAKKADQWVLQEGFRKKDKGWEKISSLDRLDPARRDALLRGFPDLWADKFVETKSLEESGLNDPETVVTVTRPSGAKVKLLIGKVSESKMRFEKPPPQPGMPPMPPRPIKEEMRYAKLDKNGKLFEIKADKLADIAVDVAELRDARLARFRTDEVKRIEIRHDGKELILAKVKESDKENAKEKWRVEKPTPDDADSKTVDELLDKVSGLQGRSDDLAEENDAKAAGFDKAVGTIKLTVEEPIDRKKADDKNAKKNTRAIVLYLCGMEKEQRLMRVDAWPRIYRVQDDLWKLVNRSDLAYRPRELWRIDRDDITRVTIQAEGNGSYDLVHGERGWKVGEPFNADVSAKDMDALTDELATLKAERFEAVKVKDLAKFGLDKPDLKISLTAKDAKPHVLEVGKRVEAGEGRYARLANGDAVFVVSDKLTANIRREPLDFLDKAMWKLDPEDIKRIRFPSFALEPKKGLWQVIDTPIAPFNVDEGTLKKTIAPLAQLRAEKYAAVGGKIDWAKFGLDKPTSTVTVTVAADAKDKTTDHTVELGKEAPGGGRYARIDKKDAVVQLAAKTAEGLQRSYLDFVDPRVLKFDADAVNLIERKMPGADLEVTRREDAWLITKPGARDADLFTVGDLLRRTSQLSAKRIAAYPAKDLTPFGLDKPAATLTLSLETPDGSTSRHVIKVGSVAAKDSGERYAMVEGKPMVVVLPAELSRHLVAPVLYYADRTLAIFANADHAELTTPTRKAVFNRTDSGWKMTQPIDAKADAAAIDDLIRNLQRLRADEMVADAKADLKKYGLDQPFLQWRLKQGSADQLHLIVGVPENAEPGARRYAKLGDKAGVFLLSSKVTAKVQGEFRNRSPWPGRAPAPTKLSVTERDKSFTLTLKDGKWEWTDDPKARVNTNAVANTLNVFDTLKALRYLADAKADLKAFGLEKPTWKIDVESGKETRSLWLGGYDEKTRRWNATVAGSGAVFVLDEIDGIILARPRSAYLEEEKKAKKTVLLLWHSPDGHPKDTHEYLLGQKILQKTLEKHADVVATLVCADEPWKEGPDLLAKADGVVLFVSEGAKWLSADEKRLAAFRAGAKRGMGFTVLHWGMGTKDAKNIDAFVELFGGCHGGPDRKYKVVETEVKVADKAHPIVRGLADFKARDEFYYALKFTMATPPLLNVSIDGELHSVAWALQRDGGGRSFGFSGLHFHENWQLPEYRRLVTQGVLWTLDLPIPKDGVAVK